MVDPYAANARAHTTSGLLRVDGMIVCVLLQKLAVWYTG